MLKTIDALREHANHARKSHNPLTCRLSLFTEQEGLHADMGSYAWVKPYTSAFGCK